jgi:hypothetical protein
LLLQVNGFTMSRRQNNPNVTDRYCPKPKSIQSEPSRFYACLSRYYYQHYLMFRSNLFASALSAALVFRSVLSIEADTPAPARPSVSYSNDESIRVESSPRDKWGTRGKTRVYQRGRWNDKVLHTYKWYAWRILVEKTPSGVALVRFGPWPGGTYASEEAHAFSFYLGGKLLKSYSTLEIAGSPSNVLPSTSHHIAFRNSTSIRFNANTSRYEFKTETLDGQLLTFNVETGQLISRSDKYAQVRESAWYKENRVWVQEASAAVGSPVAAYLNPPRAIVIGQVQHCHQGLDSWAIQLRAPVVLEPLTLKLYYYLLRIEGPNTMEHPQTNEVWAFSGDIDRFTLKARSASDFANASLINLPENQFTGCRAGSRR